MNWINVKELLPEPHQLVLVYHPNHPEKFNEDYTWYEDRRDINEEILRERELHRKWFSEHPYGLATIYQTAFAGKKWMVSCPVDSKAGFIASLDEIQFWMYLTPPNMNRENV